MPKRVHLRGGWLRVAAWLIAMVTVPRAPALDSGLHRNDDVHYLPLSVVTAHPATRPDIRAGAFV